MIRFILKLCVKEHLTLWQAIKVVMAIRQQTIFIDSGEEEE